MTPHPWTLHPLPLQPPLWPHPAVVIIKDKASDLGIKDVTDKDSWIKAKKIIDARLRRHPYSPSLDSKLLITTTTNAFLEFDPAVRPGRYEANTHPMTAFSGFA